MDSQACLTRLACNSKSVGELKGRLNSLANRAAKLGVRFGPPPPTIIGIPLSGRIEYWKIHDLENF